MDFPIDLEEIKKQDELHNKSQSIFDEELETVEKQKRNFCECGGLIVIDISNGVDMCTECRDIKNKIGVDTDLYTTEGSSGISRTCTMSEYGDHAKLYVPNLGYSNANMQHYYNSFNTKNQTLKSVFKHIDRIKIYSRYQILLVVIQKESITLSSMNYRLVHVVNVDGE